MTFNRDAYSILDRFEFFVAIPIDRLAAMLDTLRAMPWDLPALQPDGADYLKRLSESLGL